LGVVKTIGHDLKNLGHSTKLFAPPGVPSWLRACTLAYTNYTENNIHTEQIIEDFMTNTWRMEQGCSMSVSKIQVWKTYHR